MMNRMEEIVRSLRDAHDACEKKLEGLRAEVSANEQELRRIEEAIGALEQGVKPGVKLPEIAGAEDRTELDGFRHLEIAVLTGVEAGGEKGNDISTVCTYAAVTDICDDPLRRGTVATLLERYCLCDLVEYVRCKHEMFRYRITESGREYLKALRSGSFSVSTVALPENERSAFELSILQKIGSYRRQGLIPRLFDLMDEPSDESQELPAFGHEAQNVWLVLQNLLKDGSIECVSVGPHRCYRLMQKGLSAIGTDLVPVPVFPADQANADSVVLMAIEQLAGSENPAILPAIRRHLSSRFSVESIPSLPDLRKAVNGLLRHKLVRASSRRVKEIEPANRGERGDETWQEYHLTETGRELLRKAKHGK